MVETILTQAKADVYTFSLIILWISFVIVNPLIAWGYSSKKTNWGKFWATWFFTIAITGTILAFMIFSPEQTLSVFEWIKSLT